MQERAEYDKGKREQVVYTMLQDKYGLDEDQIYSEEDKRRLQSGALRPARPASARRQSAPTRRPLLMPSLPAFPLPAATLLNKINSPQGNGFPDPIYMYIVGVLAVLCYFLFRSFTYVQRDTMQDARCTTRGVRITSVMCSPTPNSPSTSLPP